MKKFCKSLREHAIKVRNFKKNDKNESYENAKIYYICKEKFEKKNMKDKKYRKVRVIVLIQGNVAALGIAYVI